MLMLFAPSLSVMEAEGLPEVTGEPFTVIVAFP
jgi:hypothetical protein